MERLRFRVSRRISRIKSKSLRNLIVWLKKSDEHKKQNEKYHLIVPLSVNIPIFCICL